MVSKVLEIENLKKQIKNKEIVKDVSLAVNEAEVFGFLGPNGAGKTTTIRMIVGLIKPTQGTVRIGGYDVQRQFTKAMEHVGCIIESPDMYRYMSGLANLKHFANMHKGVTQKRIDEVVELVGLKERIHDRVEEYSTGMCQRLGLAQAIMSKPKLLILDEPTNGLDPSGIREFRELVRMLAEQEGMGVFVSSHILSEIQLMCDKVGFIRNGTLLKTASIAELTKDQKTYWQVSDAEQAIRIFKSKWNIDVAVLEKGHLSAAIDNNLLGDINTSLFQAGIQVFYVQKDSKTLEDIFLEMTN
ncbi:ABC transporter ATP-binding protein [Desulfuribacillus alkaliarsenatis]|uniref:ABC transporter ATP-binding protein n=1 Tax=Desulfuribacillus alkaliarsenatis TaxID=766136 RepID=A0A1E5FZ43_9FIRM|nr:ABC transporter ATP-binding protein [Desulfuribacillus alkaliarsenatis]OEF95845.1 ABC transporter ATP-binding protein [Desulfuribacillus alkaliarsenatis]